MKKQAPKVWNFAKRPSETIPLTPKLILGFLGAAAVMVALGIWVHRGFFMALVMGSLCLGRFAITGTCPLIRLFSFKK